MTNAEWVAQNGNFSQLDCWPIRTKTGNLARKSRKNGDVKYAIFFQKDMVGVGFGRDLMTCFTDWLDGEYSKIVNLADEYNVRRVGKYVDVIEKEGS